MTSPTTKTDLSSALTLLGLHATASTLDDFLAVVDGDEKSAAQAEQ